MNVSNALAFGSVLISWLVVSRYRKEKSLCSRIFLYFGFIVNFLRSIIL